MFERRTDLLRLLAVAETGRIGAAAERSNVTQPTLTRDIARLARDTVKASAARSGDSIDNDLVAAP